MEFLLFVFVCTIIKEGTVISSRAGSYSRVINSGVFRGAWRTHRCGLDTLRRKEWKWLCKNRLKLSKKQLNNINESKYENTASLKRQHTNVGCNFHWGWGSPKSNAYTIVTVPHINLTKQYLLLSRGELFVDFNFLWVLTSQATYRLVQPSHEPEL